MNKTLFSTNRKQKVIKRDEIMVNRFLSNDFMNQLIINSITNGWTERKLLFWLFLCLLSK
jgi:hypothetical protein